jgi:hypothetical protein
VPGPRCQPRDVGGSSDPFSKDFPDYLQLSAFLDYQSGQAQAFGAGYGLQVQALDVSRELDEASSATGLRDVHMQRDPMGPDFLRVSLEDQSERVVAGARLAAHPYPARWESSGEGLEYEARVGTDGLVLSAHKP